MSTLLIILIILLYSLQTLFCKFYTDRYPGRPELASPVFCILESIAIVLGTLCFNGFRFSASWATVLIGVLNAAMLFGYNTSLIKASARGSYAFMNVMMLFGGILVPMLYSAIFLGETLSWYQLAAIGVMLVACVVMNLEDIKLKDTPLSYYLFCLLLFLCNGLYGTLLKLQSVQNDAQKSEMVMITFALMGVIALIQLVAKERGNTAAAFRLNRKCIVPLILCLISAALAINVLVFVIPMVNIAVFYTVENGGVLLLSGIYSILFFKEKLSLPKAAGMLLALVSITVLSM